MNKYSWLRVCFISKPNFQKYGECFKKLTLTHIQLITQSQNVHTSFQRLIFKDDHLKWNLENCSNPEVAYNVVVKCD